MTQPTSLRLPDAVKGRLDRHADRHGERPAAVAVRLIDEGLRTAAHPGIVFHDSPAHGRVASLAAGPDVAEVIDVLSGLEAQGERRVAETARWLGVHPSQVRVAVGYYAEYREEVDGEIARRRAAGDELRRRYEAEQALLG